MAIYPISPVPHQGSKTDLNIPVIKAESEGAYTKVRRTTTKTKRTWDLSYKNILLQDYQILEDFFNDNQGLSFDYTYDDVTYTVIFNQAKITKEHTTGVTASTSIQLEQV